MVNKRLIKRINEVTEEELAAHHLGVSEPKSLPNHLVSVSTSATEQTQEIIRLRELLKEYRLYEVDVEKEKKENGKLSQQNQELMTKLKELEKEHQALKTTFQEQKCELDQLKALKHLNLQEELTQLKEEFADLTHEHTLDQHTIIQLTATANNKEKMIQQLEAQLQQVKAELDKPEVLERIKMELNTANKQVQTMEKEHQTLLETIAHLKEQIQALEVENVQLKANANQEGTLLQTGHAEELKRELQGTLQEKSELESTLGRIQALNDKYVIQKDIFESELSDLRKKYEEKENEVQQLRNEVKTMHEMSKNGEVHGEQLAELLHAKQQINDLLLKNQSLQEEALKSQQEIGEVMVSAKKEANRIINEAQIDAKHMVNAAELEMLNIGNRAKNISNEVETSKNEVLAIYQELEARLNKLARIDVNTTAD